MAALDFISALADTRRMPKVLGVPIDAPPHRIRELRILRDWSQSRLAAECGLNWSTISRIERGERIPGDRTRYKIAKALGCPESEVFPGYPTYDESLEPQEAAS